jgi:SAM-dependent methyltransferase
MSPPVAESPARLRSEVSGAPPNFDLVASAYRWMEYLSLGNLLERTRFRPLEAGSLDDSRSALVLGDGDGRFTARLLRRNPGVRVTAVDASAGMLRLLRRRCAPFADRLSVRRCDARAFLPESRLDLVVTHFFLDCLGDREVHELVERVAPSLEPGARWVVSEFAVPEGWLKWPAGAFVRGLYLAFRLLTGLTVSRLPDYASALEASGFRRSETGKLLGGVLVSEVWHRETLR